MPDTDLIERELRQQYPRPSAAATARARAAVMETEAQRSRPVRSPGARRQWRPVLVGVAIVVALALVGVGIAAGFGAFEGTAAPPDVSTNFKQLNQFADAAIQKGFSTRLPQTDASKAHGVVEIQTPDGPEDLWAAPNDQGGQCYLIDWANDPVGKDGSKYGFNGCEQSPPPSANISFADVWVYAHPDVMTVYGSVYVPAAAVQITLDDGATVTLPVVENLFLASVPKGTKVAKVVAVDTGGNEVAEKTLRSN